MITASIVREYANEARKVVERKANIFIDLEKHIIEEAKKGNINLIYYKVEELFTNDNTSPEVFVLSEFGFDVVKELQKFGYHATVSQPSTKGLKPGLKICW